MKRSKAKEHKLNIFLLGGIYFLLAIILLSCLFYLKATKPYRQARSEASEIATKYAKIAEIDQFYWFNRKATYFSVLGKDDTGKAKLVLINQKSGKVHIYNQKDGYSEAEISQQVANDYPNEKISKLAIGMREKQVVWEVVTRNSEGIFQYHFYGYKTGEKLKNE